MIGRRRLRNWQTGSLAECSFCKLITSINVFCLLHRKTCGSTDTLSISIRPPLWAYSTVTYKHKSLRKNIITKTLRLEIYLVIKKQRTCLKEKICQCLSLFTIQNIKYQSCKRLFSVIPVLLLFLLLQSFLTNPSCALTGSSFSSNDKKEIVVFTFRNNTIFDGLQRSIPEVLNSELYKTGIFSVVDNNILYKTVWRLAISDNIKIDNAGVSSRERFTEQEVDLFSNLRREDVELVYGYLDADYAVKGTVNQFGDLIRGDIEIIDAYENKTLDTITFEINEPDDIPAALKDAVLQIVQIYYDNEIENVVDDAVRRYRAGNITFDTTVSILKGHVARVPSSIYSNMQLLVLFDEEGFKPELITTCESIIQSIEKNSEGALDTVAQLGIDPFERLADLYFGENRFDDVINVYTKALRIMPVNMFVYYKKLGNVYLEQNKLKDALEAFRKSAALNSRDFDVHYNLATVYEMVNQVDLAAGEYRQCLKHASGRDTDIITSIKEKIKRLEPVN